MHFTIYNEETASCYIKNNVTNHVSSDHCALILAQWCVHKFPFLLLNGYLEDISSYNTLYTLYTPFYFWQEPCRLGKPEGGTSGTWRTRRIRGTTRTKIYSVVYTL